MHTHGGDILECYSKGVMSYPPHKVIWSYTLEGNTLINSSTCSQTWPSLFPTHTHTFRAELQSFSRTHLFLIVLQSATDPKTHTYTHTKKSFPLRDIFYENDERELQVLFAHKTAKYTHTHSLKCETKQRECISEKI